MRFHLAAAGFVLYFSRFYTLSRGEYLLLLGVIALVLVCEAFNTAVESTVDLCTSEYRENARIAKDAAAGAVLFSALFALAAGIILFWDPAVIGAIWKYHSRSPVRMGLLLAALGGALVFIFLPNRMFAGEGRKKK